MSELVTNALLCSVYNTMMEPAWPGYAKNVVEAPNGDGKWDALKQYSHAAPKYFGTSTPPDVLYLYSCAVLQARGACASLGIPKAYWPDYGGDSTLRVLHYPPGATSAPHTDFDLFTLRVYRCDENAFKYLPGGECAALDSARLAYPGIHFGELLTEVMGPEFPATPHEVTPLPIDSVSVVFFVMPPLTAVLPSGVVVSDWLAERKSRSRKVVG